ncbi:hypothetical protein ACFV97_02360 [Streptomyces sp. NPDC059913]|uniref:hypothetical protein n=1 Tax=unclassified Streptomyces TaxID=2593676 RepID=UPI003652AB1A
MTDFSTQPLADAPFGWCDWHKGPSSTAVRIDVIGEDSGPAAPRYACTPCRTVLRLQPMEGQP